MNNAMNNVMTAATTTTSILKARIKEVTDSAKLVGEALADVVVAATSSGMAEANDNHDKIDVAMEKALGKIFANVKLDAVKKKIFVGTASGKDAVISTSFSHSGNNAGWNAKFPVMMRYREMAIIAAFVDINKIRKDDGTHKTAFNDMVEGSIVFGSKVSLNNVHKVIEFLDEMGAVRK